MVVPRGADQVRNVEAERRVKVHVSWRAEGAKSREEIAREDGDDRLLCGRRGLGRRSRVGMRRKIRSVCLSGSGMQSDRYTE
jgi:hypothetical protein